MRRRRELGWRSGVRRAFAAGLLLPLCLLPATAFAALLPEDFFDRVPEPGDKQAAIESDYLSQNSEGVITASGQVDMAYRGYFATADKLVFDRRTEDVTLIGNVVIRDPRGTEYAADRIEVTGNFKKAILDSMVLVTRDGARITASQTLHDEDTVTILEDGTYAPCGTCIDDKGRRIGWRVRTERMVYDQQNELIDLEQPILEVLGYPVAWLPWVRLPDPSNPRAKGFRLPSYSYAEKYGLKVDFPYFYPVSLDTDLIVTPTLLTRQGGLLSTRVDHRFGELGEVSVTASGLYQFDRGAFAGTVGDEDWRGAVQASAKFTPTENWTVGGAYSLHSDRGYLRDYDLPIRQSSINQAYATYLNPDTFGDVRVQEFVQLDESSGVAADDQDKQALALPTARFEHVQDLGHDAGRIEVSGKLLNASRAADSTSTANGVTYVEGLEGNKLHGMVQGGWSKQWTTSAGILLTPYAGLRTDFAAYDGASGLMPGQTEMFNATPIAALDVRYPLAAVTEGATHIVEPIGQIVYRGSDTTKVGITNDEAQSFFFDDTNLFSFNRFSGIDRQETGLRANVGGHYMADFADGSYLDFVAGQSFHLAGTNALGVSDLAQTGTSTGLGDTASYVVAGLRGAVNEHIEFGAKTQVDPDDASIEHGSVAAAFSYEGWRLALDYAYSAPDPALGALEAQHDVGGAVRIPLHEYWYATASAGWDITSDEFLDRSAALTYDDGYFSVTASYKADGPELLNPESQSYRLSFMLKGPGGEGYGF